MENHNRKEISISKEILGFVFTVITVLAFIGFAITRLYFPMAIVATTITVHHVSMGIGFNKMPLWLRVSQFAVGLIYLGNAFFFFWLNNLP